MAVRLVLKIEEQRADFGLYLSNDVAEELTGCRPATSLMAQTPYVQKLLMEFAINALNKAEAYNMPLPADFRQLRDAIGGASDLVEANTQK